MNEVSRQEKKYAVNLWDSVALRGRLDLITALPYMAGGVLGGLLAGRTLDRVPVKWLRLALAALLLYGGGRALLWS